MLLDGELATLLTNCKEEKYFIKQHLILGFSDLTKISSYQVYTGYLNNCSIKLMALVLNGSRHGFNLMVSSKTFYDIY